MTCHIQQEQFALAQARDYYLFTLLSTNNPIGEIMRSIRVVTTSIAMLCLLVLAPASPAQPSQQQMRELADYIKDHYSKREALIPMRDGVKLFVSIYEPKDKKQKYPIMLDRTPYSVAPYGPKEFRESLGPDELFAR